MKKKRGFCARCRCTSASEFRNIPEGYENLLNLPDAPKGVKLNSLCSSCSRNLRRLVPDPLIDEFPGCNKEPANLTAPIISNSPVAGKGIFDFFRFF